jgi:DNA-directed RNA polymerase specialized sigma24 family protein
MRHPNTDLSKKIKTHKNDSPFSWRDACTLTKISRRELFRVSRIDAGILVCMSDVSTIIEAINRGDRIAAEKLLPLVYDELRKLAALRMAQERPGQTLDATALVHEAYVRLVKVPEPGQWEGRGHFFAAAAEAMRRILVENARRKRRLRHGGQRLRVPVVDVAAQVVQMHHFAGLSHEVVADSLGLTVYRVRQKWIYAQAWLRADLKR